MKNITVTVDDEVYRKARIKAAERDTSVSALVKHFLAELAVGESDNERLKREERALRERIATFRAADRIPREDLHRRRSGTHHALSTPTSSSTPLAAIRRNRLNVTLRLRYSTPKTSLSQFRCCRNSTCRPRAQRDRTHLPMKSRSGLCILGCASKCRRSRSQS